MSEDPPVKRTFWDFNIGHLLTIGGMALASIAFVNRTTYRVEQVEKEAAATQAGMKANSDQISELRQAAFGFSYDMKTMKSVQEENRQELKNISKQIQEINQKTASR
jgi:uncharacterized protein (UPF0335 family)